MKKLLLAAAIFIGTSTAWAVEPNHAGTSPASDWLASAPAGFSYLTVSTCAAGFTPVEDGVIQLGATPNTTATGSDTKTIASANLPTHDHTIAHTHNVDPDAFNEVSDNDGSHVHNSSMALNATGGFGDPVANTVHYGTRTATSSSGSTHQHTTNINVPNTTSTAASATNTGNGGFANSPLDITPRHIVMRLCVKN